MKKTNLTIVLIGLIAIALTLATFFLFELVQHEVYIWALCFLLLAEIVSILGLTLGGKIGNSQSKSFFRSGGFVALSGYFLTTLLLTVLSGLFKRNIIVFIYIEIILLSIFAILILLVFLFTNRSGNMDRKIVESRQFMQNCEKRLHALLADSKNKSHSQRLNNLYESVKYSDKIGASSLDGKIEVKLTVLENAVLAAEDGSRIAERIDEVLTLVNQRKTELLETKRGGF